MTDPEKPPNAEDPTLPPSLNSSSDSPTDSSTGLDNNLSPTPPPEAFQPLNMNTKNPSTHPAFFDYNNTEGNPVQKSQQILELARQLTNSSQYKIDSSANTEANTNTNANANATTTITHGSNKDPLGVSPDTSEKLRSDADSIASSSKSLHRFPTAFNPFLDASNPLLDPHSDQFDSRIWAQHVLHIQHRDPERYPLLNAGVSFRNLGAFGYSTGSDYQKTVFNTILSYKEWFRILLKKKDPQITILKEFNGLVKSGETCVVLGRPGAGCSTFLKSIACDTYGFHLTQDTILNYQGITPKQVRHNYRGEVIYNAENEIHFPHLTVGDTLKFAALARTPHNRFPGVTRDQYAIHKRDVTMASFGLLHTMNTILGNDFVRGVSGGERKRVSIAEVVLAGATIQCWDNSTRGLDSATALEFIKTLKIASDISGASIFVSLYQASQDAYDLFDKVLVMYQGRQIFFGPAQNAKRFFENMGYVCIDRQTTGDYLTSLTSPTERVVKPGYEDRVPRTPDEFEQYWKDSPEYTALLKEIDEWNAQNPTDGESAHQFQVVKNAQQANHVPPKSPYVISFTMQIKICIVRGFQRLRGDYAMTATSIIGNTIAAIIMSSIFYNQPKTTASFYYRSAALFFSVLFNALSSLLEVFALYTLRPIVEKHHRYAFYRPSAEAISSLIVDMPGKILTSLGFNLVLYFMVNLKREPGAFFIYLLFSFFSCILMSGLFRAIASVTRSVSEALTPAALVVFAIVITTGFVIPVLDMHPWIRWMNYLNPLAYTFESMMVNEFRNVAFECSSIVPSGGTYNSLPSIYKTCNVVGAVAGSFTVQGSDYVIEAFKYYPSHLWRNFGILWIFCIAFYIAYLFLVEYIKGVRSKGEILIYPRGHKTIRGLIHPSDIESHKNNLRNDNDMDTPMERVASSIKLQHQEGIFQWQDVCYDIKIKGEPRRLLDQVDGWVKPGTLTALMGASGAGKTTLLDVLADRVTMGVVTGNMLVNGLQRDKSFQRKTGYVQQQDIHLASSTVREALEFSALLRQPDHIPRKEKIEYVEEVIKILEMEHYADAVVGVPGEGLNVEQRKRLTIGVELAAKPELLLFLDEPTSGLDSQTAWSIMMLMKKLTNSGQAILCTIHQPSAVLFQQFDRLLFLQHGGQTVYYGEIGPNSQTLINYFESNGADPCPPTANPAEWMLHVIGAAPGSHTDKDWFQVWRNSPEYVSMRNEIDNLLNNFELVRSLSKDHEKHMALTYAIPIWKQILIVSKRAVLHNYRDPQYIWSKIILCTGIPFFLGVCFWKAKNTIQGLQDQMYAIFMIVVIFIPLVEQLVNPFAEQRTLYETRERPSKTYSWVAFMFSMTASELPWQVFTALTTFFTFYYPVGLYRNAFATDSVHERGALFFMLTLVYYIYILTYSHMVVAAIPLPETAGNVSNVLFNISLGMSGVLCPKDALPGFWIFMYRVSPFTYVIGGMLSSGIANAEVKCSDRELLTFPVIPANHTCETFLGPYSEATLGRIHNPEATSDCKYCTMSTTDSYLTYLSAPLSEAWRNFGIIIAFIIFNFIAAMFLYWFFRMPKKWNKKKE
ncbi:uncharacterized protein SAPINGB_P001882 [Magnusiomyces paraingens]|uniref:ABC transporter domain-containing protein n=1 Tax=Magnusiomyces paraingens TaxID=2606893 RepID=A0A5E8BD73_9ASCO|nr:uncharacterized protein SAPINGB_P001882 [Saprochaete ingens]VVT48648.1 unnamed protein product [Saprochaete ingens]